MKTPTRSEKYRRQTERALARMLARRARTTSAHRLAARILLGGCAMSATGCRHGRDPSTCKDCVPSARERWQTRDQRMRAWAVSEWRRYERRETDRYRGRPWYRDLPSRRPRVLAIGHRPDGSAPDALVYARDLRETHVEHCRRVDYDPIMTARLYLDKLRAASAPVGLLPG